jgi:hypothetical protein
LLPDHELEERDAEISIPPMRDVQKKFCFRVDFFDAALTREN